MRTNLQNFFSTAAHFSVNTESKMAEVSSAETPVVKKQDKVFDPSAEMIVNDFDDERTLDEEEALEGTEDPQTELSNLQKEGDMPLEELLAMYGYAETGGDADALSSSEDDDELMDYNDESESALEMQAEPYSELQQLYADEIPKASLQEGGVPHSDDEEEEEDRDYKPEEDDEWKKNIMVGPDFQAAVPDGLCTYDDALPYENEDRMLWEPMRLVNTRVEEYLVKAHEPFASNQGVHTVPTGAHIKDDEQALYLLLQCGYNIEEALRRRRMNIVAPADTMSLWSEEECHNFENGLRIYGKDFHMIQLHKVRTRSVSELVQFYYLWKKTERHDAFANKSRIEKKKYTLHPGITDYMDRLLDEQESGGQIRDRSISPMTQCLLYGDPKRHQRVHEAYGEPGSHTLLSTMSYNSNKPSMRDFTKHLDKDSLDSFLKMAAASAVPECRLKDAVESGKCESRSQPVTNAEIAHHPGSKIK